MFKKKKKKGPSAKLKLPEEPEVRIGRLENCRVATALGTRAQKMGSMVMEPSPRVHSHPPSNFHRAAMGSNLTPPFLCLNPSKAPTAQCIEFKHIRVAVEASAFLPSLLPDLRLPLSLASELSPVQLLETISPALPHLPSHPAPCPSSAPPSACLLLVSIPVSKMPCLASQTRMWSPKIQRTSP